MFHGVPFGFALFAQKFAHCLSLLLAMASVKLYLYGRLKADCSLTLLLDSGS